MSDERVSKGAASVAVEWVETARTPAEEPFPGVRIRRLWGSFGGPRALVVEFDPGATWVGEDVHEPGPEEVYVVQGTFHDGARAYPAGTFIHNPRGSRHVPRCPPGEGGCTLFVFYPEG